MSVQTPPNYKTGKDRKDGTDVQTQAKTDTRRSPRTPRTDLRHGTFFIVLKNEPKTSGLCTLPKYATDMSEGSKATNMS